MQDAEILDSLFREAVSAIDAGDVTTLESLLNAHPSLVRERLNSTGALRRLIMRLPLLGRLVRERRNCPGAWLRDKVGGALNGFFRRPYLLWFVAEDPVRNGKLPRNIARVARAIIQAAKREKVDSLQQQLDYTLRLAAWSGVARECGVQTELMDVLVDAGASIDGISDAALVNGHLAAAEHLVDRGAKLTLATALCLGRWDDVTRLAPAASAREKQMGLVLAALNGKAQALAMLISFGVNVNAPSRDLYSHATPLHHAVCSGSLDAVKVLVESGAELGTRDKVEKATPLGWAEYYQGEKKREDDVKRYAEIAAYLRRKGQS